MPILSIIVPIYNVEKYLTKCLTSIQNQEFKDFECLLIDDCSLDNSKEICYTFCKTDSRFKYIKRQKNGGLGAARNTGLDNATGEYISFIDSDDTIEKNFYNILLPYAERYGWVYSGRRWVTEDGAIIRTTKVTEGIYYADSNPTELFITNFEFDGNVDSCIYKKDVIGDLRFDTCKYGEDYVFSLELFAKHKLIYCKEAYLYNYLKRPDSLSGDDTITDDRIMSFIDSFNKMLERINIKNSDELKKLYIANFKYRPYVKNLWSKINRGI